MALSFDTEFDDRSLSRAVQGMKKNIDTALKKDPAFVDKYLSPIIFKDILSHFDQEEGPNGPWDEWSPSYTKHMQAIGRAGNKKLQFTGFLRQSFKPSNYRKTSDGIIWFNNAKTKTGEPYAAKHNYGDEKTPAREFMWLSDNANEMIAEQTLGFLLKF